MWPFFSFLAVLTLWGTTTTSLADNNDATAGLPQNELMIGERFEVGVESDPDAKKYMIEFSDPSFFSRTSKLRKVWGIARVLDGETLIIGRQKIRLGGIKAPDISQTCREKVSGLQFDAGGYALGRLKNYARSEKAVTCYVETNNVEGTCFIWGFPGPMNIARMLVREGAAWASPRAASPYVRDEGWAEGSALREGRRKNLWDTDCQLPRG